MACDDFGCHLGFMGRLMGQHRVSDHIPNGKNVRNVGSLSPIHGDKSAFVHCHAGLFCSNQSAVGTTSYGEQHLIENSGAWCALAFKEDLKSLSLGINSRDLGLEVDIVIPLRNPLMQWLNEIRITAGNQLIHELDHRDGRT